MSAWYNRGFYCRSST